MIADFMTYRGIAIMVARLADAGNWPLLMTAAVQSITQDYSWAPAIGPGPAAGVDRADVARRLYFRDARPLRRASRLRACDPGARLRPSRRACARRFADDRPRARRRRRVRGLPCGHGGRRARHARCRRARAGCVRAQARRTPRPPARAAPGRRARSANDPPRRRRAGADRSMRCSRSGAGMRSPRRELWSCWRSRSAPLR